LEKLSERQSEIYQYIKTFREDHGYSPTFRETADGIGVSLTTVMAHSLALRDKGYITWEDKIARSIVLKQESVT
jgi:repressor LexA